MTRRVLTRFAIPLAIVLLALGAWHGAAFAAYRQSFDTSRSLDQRASAASLARRLEPFNATYAQRATVMAQWAAGARYLGAGLYLKAMLALADAYRGDIGDAELLALFKKSQAELDYWTTYKAHQQHAHEGPHGELRPGDLVQ